MMGACAEIKRLAGAFVRKSRPERYWTMSRPTLDIARLSPDERLELMEQLWESLRKDPSSVPLTDAQRDELDRRLDDLDADVEKGASLGIPWDEVLHRIRNRPR
ncbi:MAG: addiction module protein [Vicinamibacteria bacterium]